MTDYSRALVWAGVDETPNSSPKVEHVTGPWAIEHTFTAPYRPGARLPGAYRCVECGCRVLSAAEARRAGLTDPVVDEGRPAVCPLVPMDELDQSTRMMV